MEEAPLVAEGTESTVEVVGRKVVLRQRGMKTMLKRGFSLYRDPKSFIRVFDGPSKKVVTAALAENKDLAKVIVGAVKEQGTTSVSPDDGSSIAKALTEALKTNRSAVLDALRANDDLVKGWLRDHKDLAGIVLKGDIHIFIEDVTAVALASARDGRKVFVLTSEGQQLTVPFDAEHEADFRRVCAALAGAVGPLTELVPGESPAPAPPSPGPPPGAPPAASGPAGDTPSSAAAPDPAATKTCPMCAEDVKAAAVLCRFCGHRFDQAE